MPGHAPAGTGTARARRLLVCGVVAGPLWVVSVAVQALTRPGFSLTRSPASTLDLGPWGWVQVATFIVTGVLIIAAGAGMRRGVPDGLGHRWIPRLLAVIGAGTIGGGLVAAGAATASAPHGSLNLYAGVSIAFLWIAAAITWILTAARPALPAVSDAPAVAGR
jgi:hypothetical membrane protein